MPQQALALANSELAFAQAHVLTGELEKGSGGDDARFVAEGFRRVLGRRATEDEVRLCCEFLNSSRQWNSPKQGTNPLSSAKNRTSPSRDLTVAATRATSSGRPSPPQAERSRENLVRVLLNHNDFLTVR
jgi:hypothetical protein